MRRSGGLMSNTEEMIQLENFADIVMGQSPDSASCNTDEWGLPFLQGCAEFGRQLPFTEVYCFPPVRVSKPDSILISVRAPVGKLNWGEQSYCIGRGLGVIKAKPDLSDTRFLSYAIEQNVSFLHRRSQGSTFLAVGANDIKIFPIPAFPYAKQQKIAHILKTIDQTIENTEALIEKYQHIKAGLMHDLFTRGIGADGKLRPPREQAPELYQQTPIGWIPKEWSVRQLAEFSDICSGVTLGSKKAPDQTISVPYLRVANVQDGYLDLSDVKEIMVNRKTFDSLLLQAGDVLMNEGGDFDKLGRGTVWQGEITPCIHQNHVFRVRTNAQVLRHYFLAYWSQSAYGKKYFVLSSKQSTNLASINSTQLKKFPVALPSLYEQTQIEERVDAVNLKITFLNSELEKFKNQKYGLMHDLLTGKVPVRVDESKQETA
jgi:type I restriction enzyme, S subunit